MSIKNLKKDTRGAVLVYVVVAAAIIMLIGAMVTTAAFINLRTAKLKSEATENFYNTNHIANIIKCGLQDDVAEAYQNAREKTKMYSNEADAIHNFKFLFLDELDLILNDGVGTNGTAYSVKHLHGYVQTIMPDDVGYTITALNGRNAIEQINGGLILRNVHITYENDAGYFDEITTDFKIIVPGFQTLASLEEMQLDALIADKGLQVNNNVSTTINGDAYLGMDNVDGVALLLNNDASVDMINPTELVAGGLIMTGINSRLFISGPNDPLYCNVIWTDGFRLGSNSITSISGQLHMAGNMDIHGNNASVALSGKYIGFGKTVNVHSGGKINEIGSNITLSTAGLVSSVTLGDYYKNNNEMIELFAQIRSQYYGNGITSGKRHEMSYANLINSKKLTEFVAYAKIANDIGMSLSENIQLIGDDTVVLMDESGVAARIVDNAGGVAHELGNGSGLVIASGDVIVTGNWTGVIIAGGRIYCGNDNGNAQSVNITIDSVEASQVLPLNYTYQSGDSEIAMNVINIFVGYENVGAGESADSEIDNCVAIVNWTAY